MSSELNSLEAIYVSGPVPSNAHLLTILGVVFDKVHFPGVYLPRGGYDAHELDKEINRLKKLSFEDYETVLLIETLKNLRVLPELETFCQFESDPSAAIHPMFDPGGAVGKLFDAIHGPQKEGFVPSFGATNYKGIPGSEDSVIYPGIYHYVGGAMMKSSATGIPIVNDDRTLARLMTQDVSPNALSTLFALEFARVVLPNIAGMTPGALVDFREQNREHLKAFRRGMVRYAAKLDGMIKEGETDHIAERTRFLVETEIRPALDELRADIQKSNRPWGVRAFDAVALSASIAAGFLGAGEIGATLAGLCKDCGFSFKGIASGKGREGPAE